MIVAACSARGASRLSATTVTCSGPPGACGAATSTPTSTWSCSPGPGPGTTAGCGVVTAGPSTRTVTGAVGWPLPAPSPEIVTRTIASGRAAVPPNRSVEVTSVIRMPSSSHEPAPAPSLRTGGDLSKQLFRAYRFETCLLISERPHLEVRDPKTMRALAHPLRMALIEAIGQADTGTLTATEASELLGESPANCAFHLRTLAKYGFVEEAGGGRGRERPWRLRFRGLELAPPWQDEETRLAAGAAASIWIGRWMERARERLMRVLGYPPEWQEAAFASRERRVPDGPGGQGAGRGHAPAARAL